MQQQHNCSDIQWCGTISSLYPWKDINTIKVQVQNLFHTVLIYLFN